jgi:hypothetical protein
VSTKRVVCVEATKANGVLEIALQWQVRRQFCILMQMIIYE